MLFKQHHLDGIRSGTISLAFRKWKRAAARAGSLIKTSIGLVEITDITVIPLNKITNKEAVAAGFNSIKALTAMLNMVTEGEIYRIGVRYHSDDPRIQLREQTALSDADLDTLRKRLERLDRSSREGPWTVSVLNAIKAHPLLRAVDLGVVTGKEKEWLKLHIRKLKNLGLTISHDTGYTLSPLGEIVLAKLTR
ncbi:ASCH domain-containing protein [Chitinophaga agrisoli]|uniref:ASCH domain-containing protein n=1 Tax=Chitinophaga agrisoli TaxID=2607653 RepID=A0A5B2W4U4_9BACT|nr:ASCH domain-containing protein [Chitinophaga agrisoli]KAA2245447.1 ASCH domain-containing protein [Chitinophaga agrisoli]